MMTPSNYNTRSMWDRIDKVKLYANPYGKSTLDKDQKQKRKKKNKKSRKSRKR